VLGAIGNAVEKNPRLSLGLIGGTAGAASFAIPDIKRGLKGMESNEVEKQRWGLAPRVRAGKYHFLRPGIAFGDEEGQQDVWGSMPDYMKG